MKSFFKTVLLLVLAAFGIISILATGYGCISAVRSEMQVITRNPAGFQSLTEIHECGKPPVYVGAVYVCKDETITINYDIPSGKTAVLNANPATSLSPNLEKLELSSKGSLTYTVKAKSELSLKSRNTFIGNIEIMPDSICVDYPTVPTGKWNLSFEQIKPNAKTSQRKLDIIWHGHGIWAKLYGLTGNANASTQTSPPISDENNFISLECSYQPTLAQIICLGYEPGMIDLTLIIKSDTKGLGGKYFAKKREDKKLIEISGNLSFSERD